MAGNILNYFNRKRKVRLYQQWVKEAQLTPEEIPADVLKEQPADRAHLAPDDIGDENISGYTETVDINRGMVRLSMRHVLVLLSTIAFLLVALSVLFTILIMRSC